MPRRLTTLFSPAIATCLCLIPVLGQAEQREAVTLVERIQLKNDVLTLEVTPDIGGRVLSLALHGQPNFLLVSERAVNRPAPLVTADSDFIGYKGHEVWVGPQSHWWQQQDVNPARREAKAVWPPDPYLTLPSYAMKEKSAQQLVIESPSSPISGVALRKHFSLVEGNPHQVALQVTAENRRQIPVAWDIWFNTRVSHSAFVYVPVTAEADVRIDQIVDAEFGPIAHEYKDGLWSLINDESPTREGRRGKAFIQPTYGWMACFQGQQVLIIQFPLQPASTIHPEQGQVELYQEFRNGDADYGLLELEVHAPYRQLAPGAVMQGNETWWLMPYTGEQTAEAHRAFLRSLSALWK